MAFPEKISDLGSVACRRLDADGAEASLMRTPRRFGWLVLLLSALLVLLLPAGLAHAQATVFRFEF